MFAVGDVAKARAREKGAASGVFVDASKLNYQWQSCDTKAGTYTDIAGATSETLELGDELSGKYIKCTVSSKVGTSSLANSTGAIVAAAGSVNITNVSMTPSSGKVEVGSTITATAKASAIDVSTDSHVSWQWYKGTSGYASSCTTPIEGETSNTLTVTEGLKEFYVVAKADGGYGEQKPYYAAGPVSVAGQVELYDVQFEGTPGTSGVHVGDTLKTKVRKKSGSSYDYIGKTDDVSYQWQYASTSSSYDSAYTDIPGATEANYTVDAEYVGKYLRVKVTSENSVYSTQSKSYYGTSAKSPLGPVMQKGQYKLKSIAPAEATSSTLNVGATLTPVVNPSAEHPDVDVVWNGFNNGGNGTESGALTPVNPTEEASWTTRLLTDEQKNAGASVYASDPLIIGDKVYLVTSASVWGGTTWNAVLNVIDSATGAVEESVELGSSADSTCRPICSDGIIVVPLSGGYVQALSATTLETLWYTEAFTKQNLSSLTVSDGYVYINTLDYWGASSTVQNGTVKRINILTGAVVGSASSTDGGYYWAGGIVANGYYVVGGDLGQVRVYTADLSELKSSINLGSGNIRSSLVEHDGFIYAVTRDDGTLHKLSVADDGSISEVSKVQFAAYSTSTPSFSGNYAFIGGATSTGWTAKGMLSVVNLSDMSVRQITQADGSDLMAESKSTPLVVSRDGETYAYFTCNGASEQEGNWPDSTYGTGGGIYLYKLGDTEATEVYIPGRGLAQYCTASVICDAAGNLYYTNDSGNLFCIKSQSHRVVFDSQGGSSVDGQTPADGSVLKVPSNPARAGYVFDGWYVDAACTQAYDFDTPVTADFTLYAKWRLSSANSGDDNGGQGDGSNGSSSGGGAARAAGTVAPSAAPVSAASSAASTAASASSKGAAQTSSESGATGATRSSSNESPSSEAAVASSADGESTASGVAMWAYVVLVIGLAGLAGAFVWFVVARRSKNQRR